MRGQEIYSSQDEATTSPSSSESEEAKREESSEEIYPKKKEWMMQSYPLMALDRRLQEDWARAAEEGPRVLNSLRVDFGAVG